MNTTKHTPGPWAIAPKDTNRRVIGPTSHSVAVATRKGSQEESEANARLIAAAPELLEALEASILLHFEHTPEIHVREFLRTARAAIAKVTNPTL